MKGVLHWLGFTSQPRYFQWRSSSTNGKNDMATNMATFLFFCARGVLWRSNFLGNLEPLNKKLGLVRTPTRGILIKISILFAIPTFASNNLFLGTNSRSIGAYLHWSLNWLCTISNIGLDTKDANLVHGNLTRLKITHKH